MSQENWNEKLLQAINKGNLKDVEKYLKNGADIDHIDGDGDTPLSNAVYYNHLKIVQALVLSGADLNKTGTPTSSTPLSLALKKGHLDIAKYLACKNTRLTISCHDPLIYAVVCGKIENVQSLLESKIEINRSTESGITALSWAAILGHLNILKLLVEAGADVNHVDVKKKTSITHALEADNLHIVEYLITRGCQVPWLEESGELRRIKTVLNTLDIIYQLISRDPTPGVSDSPTKTCLSNAIRYEDLDILKYLEGKGLNVSRHATLSEATLTGNLEITEYLMSKGCNVNKIDSEGPDVCKAGQNGRTPLSVAVELENLDLVKLLLDKGASPTMQTAFIEAIQVGNLPIIRYLEEKGALVNFMYEDGHTPLTKAIQQGHIAIAKFLCEQGADADAVINDEKKLHLMNYINNNNVDMVKFLVELGVKLDFVCESGYTPLTKAIELENFQLVKYFIQKGANINFVDGNRKVPLGIAAENSCFSIVKFLIESEADIKLAKAELATYCNWNKDIAIYLKLMNKEISTTITGSGHDGCDSIQAETEEE